MSDNTKQPAFPYRSVLACAIGYSLFVIYASLVPLHYRPLEWRAAVIQFRDLFTRPISFEQWADFTTNILLFIPLAFFWLGFTKRHGSRRQTLLLVIVVTGCCAILSAAIEFLQLWFPPRDSALDDIVAETIGAAIGAGVWLLDEGAVRSLVATVVTAATPRNKVQGLLLSYCASLACLAIIPLERTSGGSDLFQSFHEGKISAVPFGYNYASATGLACSVLRDVLCFSPVGTYLAGCRLRPGRTTQPIWPALSLGLAFVTALQLMQVIVYDRVFSVSGWVSGATGIVLGYFTMRRSLPGPLEPSAAMAVISLPWTALFLASVVTTCFVLELLASR